MSVSVDPVGSLHTSSSIGRHTVGNPAHVVAAPTTAVGAGTAVLMLTSALMARRLDARLGA